MQRKNDVTSKLSPKISNTFSDMVNFDTDVKEKLINDHLRWHDLRRQMLTWLSDYDRDDSQMTAGPKFVALKQ